MAQVVEADARQSVLLQHFREAFADIVGTDEIAERIDADHVEVFLGVIPTVKAAISMLWLAGCTGMMIFMSHADVGAFTEDEKTVVCRTSEVCYTFRKQRDRLIYDAKESTPMGSCRMEEEWIPDGTVFLLDPHFGAAGDK